MGRGPGERGNAQAISLTAWSGLAESVWGAGLTGGPHRVSLPLILVPLHHD